MAKINTAYCLEMDKKVTSSQARVAFLSSDNIYEKFHFYCIHCGIQITSTNVMKREELTYRNRTSHFKNLPRRFHMNPLCEELNARPAGGGTGGERTRESDPNMIVYTIFKLEQLNYEIEEDIDSDNAPENIDENVLSVAELSQIEADIYTTSAFLDVIKCYEELRANSEESEHRLDIDFVHDQYNNTYETTFKKFDEVSYLHDKGFGYFQNKILYGKIHNRRFNDWSFTIDNSSEYKIWDDEDRRKLYAVIKIRIEEGVLNSHPVLKSIYEDNIEKGKLLNECYIINCEPVLEKLPNASGNGFHFELIFNIENLNHLHLTFTDSNDE